MTKKQICRRSTRRKPPGHTLPAVYAAAAKALAACVHVSDAKEIRDQADAMVVYAKSAKDSTLIVEATKAKFQAETRCGELLLTMEKNRGAIAGKTGRKGRPVLDQTPTLESLGISKTQSKRWQDLAKRKDAVPDFWQKQLDRLCRIAAAVTEGDRATLDALNAEKHANAKLKRDVNERLLADGIRQLPGKKHGVILSDPGLKFVTWSEKGMTRTNPANHYGVSDLDAILKLDIDRIAAPDCVLFHWATSPRLEDALTIMTTWRFSNPSHIVWLKDRTGTGYWVRNRHEILLIGTRGNVPAPAPGTQPESVIAAPVGRHSAKPEIFHQIIEQMFPHLPKIELFRRGPPRPGWSAWGAEAINTDDDGRRTNATAAQA